MVFSLLWAIEAPIVFAPNLYIHSFIYLFIYLFIHSYIYLFIYFQSENMSKKFLWYVTTKS